MLEDLYIRVHKDKVYIVCFINIFKMYTYLVRPSSYKYTVRGSKDVTATYNLTSNLNPMKIYQGLILTKMRGHSKLFYETDI